MSLVEYSVSVTCATQLLLVSTGPALRNHIVIVMLIAAGRMRGIFLSF